MKNLPNIVNPSPYVFGYIERILREEKIGFLRGVLKNFPSLIFKRLLKKMVIKGENLKIKKI